MTKALFLDIDGVMKPGRCYFRKATLRDGDWDPLAVQCINRLVARAEATVVFNTAWTGVFGEEGLFEIAKREGLIFSDHAFTRYPRNQKKLSVEPSKVGAIRDWLSQNTVTHWCAFDDYFDADNYFGDLSSDDVDRLISINGENGISVADYRRATEILGVPDKFLTLI